MQEQLFVTREVADVAALANEMGFNITGSDVLRAQAGRVLTLPSQELQELVIGHKAKRGAQWGRAGKGWLDNAGFWIIELLNWDCSVQSFDPHMDAFFERVKADKEVQEKLLAAKNFANVADVAHEYDYEVASVDLLKHQAIQILKLDNEKTEIVSGKH